MKIWRAVSSVSFLRLFVLGFLILLSYGLANTAMFIGMRALAEPIKSEARLAVALLGALVT